MYDQCLVSRIYKDPLQFNNDKITRLFLNGQRTRTDVSPEKIYKWPIST